MRTLWKKGLSLLLALALLLSFTACSKQEGGTNAATTDGKSDKTTTSGKTDPTEPTVPDGDGEHTHSYEAVVTEPTCTEQGYTTHTCACGDSYVDSYVDALGHDFAPATCTTPKICLHCEAIEGEALGHAYENGSCSRCGEFDPDYTAPTTL